jgi:hypothetical protein
MCVQFVGRINLAKPLALGPEHWESTRPSDTTSHHPYPLSLKAFRSDTTSFSFDSCPVEALRALRGEGLILARVLRGLRGRLVALILLLAGLRWCLVALSPVV